MSDEREGKHSASGIEGIALCPGKAQAERGLPEDPTKDSKQGDLIHAALAGDVDAYASLTSDQQSIADELGGQAYFLTLEVFGDADTTRSDEIRCWNLTRGFSAKLDRIYICDAVALIIDFKTGRNDVSEASNNLQLRTQAVCAAAELKCHTIYVAIVQIGHKPTLCKYELPDLTHAELEILGIINESEKENAPRIPGEKQCMYCRARLQCPERLHSMGDVTPMLPVVQSKGLPVLPAADLAIYLDKIPAIERICDDLKAEAKRRLQAGEDLPGYKLAHKSPREVIIDLPTVHARAEKLFGIKTEDFTAACSLTKSAAKMLIQQAKGYKGKLLDENLDALIDGCTEPGKVPEPSLERDERQVRKLERMEE